MGVFSCTLIVIASSSIIERMDAYVVRHGVYGSRVRECIAGFNRLLDWRLAIIISASGGRAVGNGTSHLHEGHLLHTHTEIPFFFLGCNQSGYCYLDTTSMVSPCTAFTHTYPIRVGVSKGGGVCLHCIAWAMQSKSMGKRRINRAPLHHRIFFFFFFLHELLLRHREQSYTIGGCEAKYTTTAA